MLATLIMTASVTLWSGASQTLAALSGEPPPEGRSPVVGHKVPAFRFEGLAGEIYEPATFSRKALLLKFGASW